MNGDPLKADIDATKECKTYIKSRKLPAETVLFKVVGQYHVMRAWLSDTRNMVEIDWVPKFEKESYKGQAFVFLYTTKSRDCFRMALAPW